MILLLTPFSYATRTSLSPTKARPPTPYFFHDSNCDFFFSRKNWTNTIKKILENYPYIEAVKPSSMAAGTTTAGRVLNIPKLSYNEMLIGLNASQKNSAVGLDLMQNCDLPPPVKVFAGSDNKTVLSSMNRVFGLMGTTREDESQSEFDGGENHEKLELLKALRYSQTRAREAEKKAEVLAKERDCLSDAMFEDAKQLFGHRQLVRLLELQVLCMNTKWAEKEKNQSLNGDHEGDNGAAETRGVNLTWVVALAFCFGIAGVGFALGCRYLY